MKPHGSREAFAEAHAGENAGCHYAPCEAIAVRVIGWAETSRGATPRIAFTYRKVRPEALTVLRLADDVMAARANRFPWPDGARYVSGRV